MHNRIEEEEEEERFITTTSANDGNRPLRLISNLNVREMLELGWFCTYHSKWETKYQFKENVWKTNEEIDSNIIDSTRIVKKI